MYRILEFQTILLGVSDNICHPHDIHKFSSACGGESLGALKPLVDDVLNKHERV